MALRACSVRACVIYSASVLAMAVMALGLVSCHDGGNVTFEKATIKVKGNVLHVELARTEAQRERGLQERKELGEGDGMLFIFDSPEKLDFWMDKTLVPLSIAFMNDRGVIKQIEDMEPMTQTLHTSKDEVSYALEVKQGWFQRHSVKEGDWVDLSGVPER